MEAIKKILELYHSRCADSSRASNYDKAMSELAAIEQQHEQDAKRIAELEEAIQNREGMPTDRVEAE